jgi:hypothetical protein
MTESDARAEQFLEVDRAEFVMRLGVIAKLDGVGKMPITLRFDGENLILTYGCVIRVKASGDWPEEARLSKAELKRFIKGYRGSRVIDSSGQATVNVKRFVRVLSNPLTALHLTRQDDTTLLIDGHPLTCTWLAVS